MRHRIRIRRAANPPTSNPKQHRACGGGVTYIGTIGEVDPYPRFQCSKCGQTWTCGKDGGPWALLVPEIEKGKEETK